jgi:hypothetical protein
VRFYRFATAALLLSAIAATLRLVVPMAASDGDAPVLKIEKMYRDYRREFRDVPDVTATDLRSLLENGEVSMCAMRMSAPFRQFPAPSLSKSLNVITTTVAMSPL